VSALANINGALNRSEDESDSDSEEPWDDTKALLTWLKICGPTEISFDLLPYLQSEVAIRCADGGAQRVEAWRQTLGRLINEVLRRGMPCERLTGGLKFHELQRHARQAEAALLVLHRCCVDALMAAADDSLVPTASRPYCPSLLQSAARVNNQQSRAAAFCLFPMLHFAARI